MSIQSQAILKGHLEPRQIAETIEKLTGSCVIIRLGHKDSYRIIEINGPTGLEIIHLFLESSVADDYCDITDEPSTFVSTQMSPFSCNIVRRIAEIHGGFFRKSERDDWLEIAATAPLSELPS
jgi:hypothetical protein